MKILSLDKEYDVVRNNEIPSLLGYEHNVGCELDMIFVDEVWNQPCYDVLDHDNS